MLTVNDMKRAKIASGPGFHVNITVVNLEQDVFHAHLDHHARQVTDKLTIPDQP